MNGVKYLLDTNFILGMLKSTPDTLAIIRARKLMASECAYSAVTRVELLGFPEITADEDALICQRLAQFTYLPITSALEDGAIRLRRSRKVKLPDALIASTALCHGLELLTLDIGLQSVMKIESAVS